MQLGEYNVHIIVDGKELQEYDVVHESPTRAVCWIASEEGKTFSIRWKCLKQMRPTAVSGAVTIDGISCGSKYLRPGRLGNRDTVDKSCVNSATVSRDFVFSRVQLSDDDSLLDKEAHRELGDICLTLRHGKLIKIAPRRRSDIHGLGSNDNFHERTKKATVHHVGLGPERTERHKPFTNHVVSNSEPKLALVFKYRPLAVLQANGIIPRPPPPDRKPRTDVVEIDTQNDPEIPDVGPRKLNDKIQILENELKRLREMQADTSDDRKFKRVKKEDSEPRKRPHFTPGEVIDLT